ncbi:amidohydrolase family protein [Nonomuraea jabiensis]|uniref:Cytosine/adenosine deaminase-related metal-dependent hydrolase n=1 Tax=Nonomuraea jabiensis TaxID=882448 RepID=A0A7W9L9B7_9ACTN|nr:amidohydrolase family protein [Nonomuraea jabiensis]MBB5775391.1 cytosine/adenosine deaminase-related metal-dependent hydrolase [Nonomuraea jabiensis]
MDETYKFGAQIKYPMDGIKLFYLATLGAAAAMGLEGVIGSLQRGHEADFVVLDPAAAPVLAYRTRESRVISDVLFALALLGDDRAVTATYVGGRLVHERQQ